MNMIISCEHASASVPDPYAGLFAGTSHILKTHRGYDIGALEVGRRIEALAEEVFYGRCSRLLIDLNRSRHHPHIFSSFSRNLPISERERIFTDWYDPFRTLVLQALEQMLVRHGEVLHLSLHSFTLILDGVVRPNDIGILYDPSRHREKEFARQLAAAMRAVRAGLTIRMNYPYRGTSDGHTTALRRRFSTEGYLGIELEINQRLLEDDRGQADIGQLLYDSFNEMGIGNSLRE